MIFFLLTAVLACEILRGLNFFCVSTNKAMPLLEHVRGGSAPPLPRRELQPLITRCVTAVCRPACQLWLPRIMGAIYASSPWDYNTCATADVHKWPLMMAISCRSYQWTLHKAGCLGGVVCTLLSTLSNLIKNSSWQWRQRAAETAPWKPRQAGRAALGSPCPRDIGHSGPLTHK